MPAPAPAGLFDNLNNAPLPIQNLMNNPYNKQQALGEI
jgi:hypothetical protein